MRMRSLIQVLVLLIAEVSQLGHIETLTMVGSGSTATGISSYCPSGSVSPIYIKNMGKKYSALPTVGFTSAQTEVLQLRYASITNEYINCNGLYGGMVKAVHLTNAGCGYTVAPMITFQTSPGDDGVSKAPLVESSQLVL